MLTRKKRTRILVEGSPDTAKNLSRRVAEAHEIHVIEEPNEGLVMVRMRETSKRSLLNLGEVLVTECRVRLGETIGIGIVCGHKPELAYDLAVIDAACAARVSETEGWDEILLAEEAEIEKRLTRETASVLETKVNFETIDNALGAGA